MFNITRIKEKKLIKKQKKKPVKFEPLLETIKEEPENELSKNSILLKTIIDYVSNIIYNNNIRKLKKLIF
jgi:hypothetical protein